MAVSPHSLKPFNPEQADALESIIDNELSKESLEHTDSIEFSIQGVASTDTLSELRQRYLSVGWKQVILKPFVDENDAHYIHLEFFA